MLMFDRGFLATKVLYDTVSLMADMAQTKDVAKSERKERREERRERQREENVRRAEKMHLARLNAAPHDGAKERTPPSDGAPTAPARFNVGCSGWFYWHW